MNYRGLMLGGVAVTAVLLSGCGAAGAGKAAAGAAVTTVTAADTMRFSPNKIDVKVGQTVSITLKNTGQIAHDFVTTGATKNINLINVGAGKELTATFEANKPGTYQIVCNQPGHKEAGMVGTIVVS